MATFRWSAVLSLIGATAFLIGTIFHPPLTDPWNTTYAFHEMVHHHSWIMDHWLFFLGLAFWLNGLAHLGDLYSSSNHHLASGGRSAARCFIGSLIMWMMILSVEIAVLPPLIQSVIVKNDHVAREIWNALFTWGLFAGYLAIGLVYIGILFLSQSLAGLMGILAKVTGFVGVIGVLWSLFMPNSALIIQLVTAPLPFLWTIWFAFRHIKQ